MAPVGRGIYLSRAKPCRGARIYDETLLMLGLLKDLSGFMRERKKFWLAPLIVVSLLLGALIVFAPGSAVALFIYALF